MGCQPSIEVTVGAGEAELALRLAFGPMFAGEAGIGVAFEVMEAEVDGKSAVEAAVDTDGVLVIGIGVADSLVAGKGLVQKRSLSENSVR